MKIARNSETVATLRRGNKADVADFFGVHLTTVDSWIRRGCPYLQRGSKGKPWELDLLDVAKWHFGAKTGDTDNPEDMSPKERLDWYKGCRERDAHAKDRGELLDAKAVVAQWTEMIQVAKGRLMALPSRLSPIVIGMDDLREIEQCIRTEILAVLEELSNGD